jgi:hypothetical protein
LAGGAGLVLGALGLTLAGTVAIFRLCLGLFLGRIRGGFLGAGDAGRGQDECPAADDCRDGSCNRFNDVLLYSLIN